MSLSVSVIIPNLNSRVVDRTLAALRTQTVAPEQVLVVGLDEPGLVNEDGAVQLLATYGRATAARNRNLGILHSTGELLCFIDADCIPRPDWLEQVLAAFADERVQVLGGGVAFAPSGYWTLCDNLSWFYQFLVTTPPGERPHLPSLNLCVRREVIAAVGLFDERYTSAAEDVEWTERMRAGGFRLSFKPQAAIVHAPQGHSFRALWREGVNYGRHSRKIYALTTSQGGTGVYRLLPRRWWAMILLAPLLASLATLAIFKARRTWRYGHALPGVWLSKLAWCWGAAEQLRRQETSRGG